MDAMTTGPHQTVHLYDGVPFDAYIEDGDFILAGGFDGQRFSRIRFPFPVTEVRFGPATTLIATDGERTVLRIGPFNERSNCQFFDITPGQPVIRAAAADLEGAARPPG